MVKLVSNADTEALVRERLTFFSTWFWAFCMKLTGLWALDLLPLWYRVGFDLHDFASVALET